MSHAKRPEFLLGAHLSTAGGLLKTLERAAERRCDCVQIFAGTPRAWSRKLVTDPEAEAFRAAAPGYGVRCLIIHASYLVNLASPDPELLERSRLSLRQDLEAAAKLGAAAVVVHPGSGKIAGAAERLAESVASLLPSVPGNCRLLLEVMAGAAGSLGSLEILGGILGHFDQRLGICLDTAHLCAAGYNLGDSGDFRRFDRDLRRWVGYARIGCCHVNDARFPCGSHRDVHENLGEGQVGAPGLRRWLAHPAFRGLPMIMETPGFDQKGPDLANMRRLRSLLPR